MNRLVQTTPSLPEVWCTDQGLHVEATARGIRVWGVATGTDGALGLRFGEGVSVELSLRAGMGAETAVKHLLQSLSPALRLEALVEAEGALLIVAPSAGSAVMQGTADASVVQTKTRPLADTPAS